ncbi:FeoC-like transcriptional regulator, partial [Turicimonas muris]|uniref:FeoC-like transcriptional regulator n=1 Tax=Turicimonas muris TaxID=1796652 RepID=UPI00343E5901
MTLSELKILVQERGQISLKELSLHFGSDESAIEAMMDRWIQKGLVKKVENSVYPSYSAEG